MPKPPKRKQDTDFKEVKNPLDEDAIKSGSLGKPLSYSKETGSGEWLVRPRSGAATSAIHSIDSHQIEAACGDLYRLIAGLHQPKYRVLQVSDGGSETKVASKRVAPFTDFKSLADSGKLPTAKELQDAGFCQILIASFFLQENDLNGGNIGLGKTRSGKAAIIKIDHEESLRVSDRCPISTESIRFFPFIKKGLGSPKNWPPGWSDWKDTTMKSLQSDEDFQRDKFKYLLKIVLLDTQIFKSIAYDHIEEKGGEALVEYLEARRLTLEETLLKMPEFTKLLVLYGKDYIKELVSEFKEYNAEYESKIEKYRKLSEYVLNGDIDAFKKLMGKKAEKFKDWDKDKLLDYLEKKQREYQARLIDVSKIVEKCEKLMDPLNLDREQLDELKAKEELQKIKKDIVKSSWKVSLFGSRAKISVEGDLKSVPKGIQKILTIISEVESEEKMLGPTQYTSGCTSYRYRNALEDVRKAADGFSKQDHFLRSRTTQSKYVSIRKPSR